jgi:hypothetical protein
MKNLQFEHDGVTYTIDFDYATSIEQRSYHPRRGVSLYEEREVRITYAILLTNGRYITEAAATCQPEDRFVKETGRSLAIRKLAKSLANQQLATAMLKCYFNRPRGNKNETR